MYTEDEIKRLGEICLRRRVLVISDEVHSDFIFEGRHIPFTKAVPEMRDQAIILAGPNKTFNLAGLKCSNVIIHSRELRERFANYTEMCGVQGANTFALTACRAAYLHGDAYVKQLCAQIKENIGFLDRYLESTFPKLRLIPPQGTYLVWIDAGGLNMADGELHRFLFEEAKVWADEGYIFGPCGSGYIRLNLACPVEHVKEAVGRIKAAYERKTRNEKAGGDFHA